MNVSKLVQKDVLKGTRAFEIVDDAVQIEIKPPFRKPESLTVMLSVLNPEPVIGKSVLEFTSRVNNEALVSLYLGKPNSEEFNAFVNLLKQKAQDEFKSFAGLKAQKQTGLEGNVYDEPPEFEDIEESPKAESWKPIRTDDLEESIRMLRDYVGDDDIAPLMAALEALLQNPTNIEARKNVFNAFDALGPRQGAVLTYAPYVGILMSGDPYDNF